MLNHQGQLQPVAIASDIFLHLNGFMFHGLVVKFDAIIRRFYMVFVVFTGFLFSYTARIPLLPLARVTPVAAASTNSPHQRISTMRFSM